MNYRRTGHTAWRTLGDETLVLDLETKRMFGLNDSAAFLWNTLEAMESFDDILRAMTSGEPAALSARDLAAFCDSLVELGLLEKGRPEKRVPVAIEPPTIVEPPRVVWQETLEAVAQSCAFMPAQSPLCNQVPFN